MFFRGFGFKFQASKAPENLDTSIKQRICCIEKKIQKSGYNDVIELLVERRKTW